jgi:hypothetical protein
MMQMVIGYYVPLVVISVPVLAWQLITRRHEPLVARD